MCYYIQEVMKMLESRLFRIVYYLLQNGKATAPELAQKFEVSIRTIYRDIDALSSAGIPIYATQGKGGGISILNNYTLDKSLLSEQEQEQMLTALQGMTATIGKNSSELLTKLSALFQIKSTNWIDVDFSDWAHRAPQQDIFNIIKEAIFQKKVISFCYFSRKGNKEKRTVKPIQLVFKSKSWYLYSFCLLRNDYRFFKLTRIRELELLSETFTQDFAPTKDILSNEIHDFTVYPLEGIWKQKNTDTESVAGKLIKENLEYTIMIRQPDFIKVEMVCAALERVKIKKPNQLYEEIIFDTTHDGKCVEILHIGSYDNEPFSFEQMDKFAEENGLQRISDSHREIYLTNRAKADKLKTILRYRVN